VHPRGTTEVIASRETPLTTPPQRQLPGSVDGPGDLAVHRYRCAECTVLEVAGEIDGASAPLFRDELTAAIAQPGERVVVDLTGVAFMDCSGVGELVQAVARTGWTTGSVCLTHPTRLVRRVLDLTRVATVCPIYESVEAAVGDSA
jgi:anti-sigma B factor antagonist